MYRIALKNMARWRRRFGGQLKMLSAPSLAHVISYASGSSGIVALKVLPTGHVAMSLSQLSAVALTMPSSAPGVATAAPVASARFAARSSSRFMRDSGIRWKG